MSGESDLVEQTAMSIFRRELKSSQEADGSWPVELWELLENSGLTLISVGEAGGGSGGTLSDLAAVVRAAAYWSASVPIGETALAASLLESVGTPITRGPMTVAVSDELRMDVSGPEVRLSGVLSRVPWARHANRLVVVGHAGESEVLFPLDPNLVDIAEGSNLAGEPRDDVSFSMQLPVSDVVSAPPNTVSKVRIRTALNLVVAMDGAAASALWSTIAYAREREQFGRPIASFQALQHQIAAMAGEVAALHISSEAAVHACETGSIDDRATVLAVASAKVQAGLTAQLATRVAHQVHGAIGYTQEHHLRLSTTRLWSWRDECGNEAEWASTIGKMALGGNGAELWPLISRTSF